MVVAGADGSADGGAGAPSPAAAAAAEAAELEALYDQLKREAAADADPGAASTLNTFEHSKLRGLSGPLDADLESMQGAWEEKHALREEGKGMRPGGPFHGLFGEERFFPEDLPPKASSNLGVGKLSGGSEVFDLRHLDFGRRHEVRHG